MPVFKPAKLNKISKILKALPKRLAEKSFLFFLGLLLIVLVLGMALFYYYVFLLEMPDEIIAEEVLKIDTEAQQRVLEEWQKRNQSFQAADFKKYPDPFNVD